MDSSGLGVRRAVGFVAPALLLIGIFLVFPALWTLYIGITNYQLTGPGAANPQVVGLDNLVNAVRDPLFTNSVWLTALFVLFSAVIGQNFLGFALAWLLRSVSPWLRRTIEGLVLLSWILPSTVVAFLWFAVLSRDTGTLGLLLGSPETSWLVQYPMVSLIIFNIWRGTAFSMLVYSAALSEVPKEIEEAARVDGAGTWRRLFSVTLPMVRRSIATNLMLITLQTLSVFGLIWTMTRGGPSNQSATLPIYAYQQAFQFGDLGYGTALALVLLLIGGVFSLVYLRALRLGESMS